MSKPLIADPRRISEAKDWHVLVFSTYGGPKKICALCSKPGATDAAHVIPRAMLGPLRYKRVEFGRPAHRECHIRQEAGFIDFPRAVHREAVSAHNRIAKVKIVL